MVSADPDGTLVEKVSGTEFSYLFWEAQSNPAVDSPATMSKGLWSELFISSDSANNNNNIDIINAPSSFEPSRPILSSSYPNVVLLSIDDLLPYLDKTLENLTAARNDIITSWLPRLFQEDTSFGVHGHGKHKPFVTLRFLPQKVYDDLANLDIKPKPDVVIRVFMIFKTLCESEVMVDGKDNWSAARERASSIAWRRVIGLSDDAADGVGKFRMGRNGNSVASSR